MKLYLLEPEVAGGHGDKTVYRSERAGHISEKIVRLDYEFFGWLGDDLLASHPAFIVTVRLAKALEERYSNNYTPLHIRDCDVSVSGEYKDRHPYNMLPAFKHLVLRGGVETDGLSYWNWLGHPFSVTASGQLVVTGDALAFLESFNLNHCEIRGITSREC